MIDSERIGRAIRTLRLKAGYTQKQLAEKLFVSDMAVSKWERGKSTPDPAALQQLAVLLDMDVDGLLDGSATYLDDRWHGVLLLSAEGLSADTLLYDKPLIDYQLSYFLLAGVRDVLVACPAGEEQSIRSRFRDGEALGISLRFTRPEKLTAENVLGAQPDSSDIMFVSEPFFLYGVDLSRFLQRAMQHKSPVVDLASVVGRSGATLREGFSHYRYRPLPLHFLQARFLAACGADTSLRDLPRLAEEKKRLRMEPMDKGFILSALRTVGDGERVAGLVKSIQELGDYLIYCPPEIAWRRGMLDRSRMRQEAARFPEYREYLLGMISDEANADRL